MQINFKNGSKIIFRGLDDPAKLKSIVNVSLIWIEEAAEISYNAFKELIGRLRHPKLNLHMILTLNPVAKSNWVYKHFFESKNLRDEDFYSQRILKVDGVYYHHSTADDNTFLPESYKSTLEEMKTYDPDLYRIARLGRFGVNGVKVLPQFEVMNCELVAAEIAKIPARFHFVGLDFGFETSFDALVKVAVDDENKFLYIYDEFYKNHITIWELAQALKKMLESNEIVRCDSAEPRSIEELRRLGINARAAKKWAEGGRHARLANLRKVKSFKKIICSSSCLSTIGELQDLTFKKDKNDELLADEFNIDSHTLSAIEYSLDSYHLNNPKTFSRKDLFGY